MSIVQVAFVYPLVNELCMYVVQLLLCRQSSRRQLL